MTATTIPPGESSGPMHDALVYRLPSGSKVAPRAIELERPRGAFVTLFLLPLITSFYSDLYAGWMEVTLPDGTVALSGFNISDRQFRRLGQDAAEREGREAACAVLIEWVLGRAEVVTLRDGGALPVPGVVAVIEPRAAVAGVG